MAPQHKEIQQTIAPSHVKKAAAVKKQQPPTQTWFGEAEAAEEIDVDDGSSDGGAEEIMVQQKERSG
jgi:hypothetical protein